MSSVANVEPMIFLFQGHVFDLLRNLHTPDVGSISYKTLHKYHCSISSNRIHPSGQSDDK